MRCAILHNEYFWYVDANTYVLLLQQLKEKKYINGTKGNEVRNAEEFTYRGAILNTCAIVNSFYYYFLLHAIPIIVCAITLKLLYLIAS